MPMLLLRLLSIIPGLEQSLEPISALKSVLTLQQHSGQHYRRNGMKPWMCQRNKKELYLISEKTRIPSPWYKDEQLSVSSLCYFSYLNVGLHDNKTNWFCSIKLPEKIWLGPICYKKFCYWTILLSGRICYRPTCYWGQFAILVIFMVLLVLIAN